MANTYQSTYTGAQHDIYAVKSNLIDLIYPIGSIYMSMNETNPSILFGGTWERISGRFLLGCGEDGPGANNDTGFGQLTTDQQTWFSQTAPGVTSGQYKHNHTYGFQYGGWYRSTILESNVSAGLLNYDINNNFSLSSQTDIGGATSTVNNNATTSWKETSMTHYRMIANTSTTHNMPPFITVAIWQRIA